MDTGADRTPALDAAAKGAVAGMAGSIALMLAEQIGRRTILPEGGDTTSLAAGAVTAVASEHGHSLSRANAETLGVAAELASAAVLGAVFGVVRSRVRAPALVEGLVLAALAYYTTSSSKGILPRVGMSPTLHQNMEEASVSLAAHVAFGVTTAAIYEAAV